MVRADASVLAWVAPQCGRGWGEDGVTIRFGTDGWRAVIAEDFTFNAVRNLARAVARVALAQAESGRPHVVVGYDRRFLSDAFAEVAASVLAEAGVNVSLTSGPVPTPAVSDAVRHLPADLGLVVTASHNPARFNGIKIKNRHGASASRDLLGRVERALDGQSEPAPTLDGGKVQVFDPVPDYLERLRHRVPVARLRSAGLTVVVDPMFGVNAGLLPELLGGDSTDVVEINTVHNPLFPGIAGPEPVERHLGRLGKVVADGGATIGIAFDGDGDRIGVVDEHGRYVSTQHVFALLTRYVLSVRRLRGAIVKSVTGSAMIDRLGELASVPVIETATGFPYIAEAMIDEDAVIGGEESGGIAFGFHLPERDGILSALALLDYIVHTGKPVSQLLTDLEAHVGTWCYQRADLPLPAQARETAAARIAGMQWPPTLAGIPVRGVEVIDGTRVELADGSWLLARPSGTEPLFRLYAEAHSEEAVEALLREARDLLGV